MAPLSNSSTTFAETLSTPSVTAYLTVTALPRDIEDGDYRATKDHGAAENTDQIRIVPRSAADISPRRIMEDDELSSVTTTELVSGDAIN